MAASDLFGPTLRLSNVALSRDTLEVHLGRTVDLFEPARSGNLFYAQFNLPEQDDQWSAIMAFVEKVGSKLLELMASGSIGHACLDLALPFYDDKVTASALIPSAVMECLGRNRVEIEISVYLTVSENSV